MPFEFITVSNLFEQLAKEVDYLSSRNEAIQVIVPDGVDSDALRTNLAREYSKIGKNLPPGLKIYRLRELALDAILRLSPELARVPADPRDIRLSIRLTLSKLSPEDPLWPIKNHSSTVSVLYDLYRILEPLIDGSLNPDFETEIENILFSTKALLNNRVVGDTLLKTACQVLKIERKQDFDKLVLYAPVYYTDLEFNFLNALASQNQIRVVCEPEYNKDIIFKKSFSPVEFTFSQKTLRAASLPTPESEISYVLKTLFSEMGQSKEGLQAAIFYPDMSKYHKIIIDELNRHHIGYISYNHRRLIDSLAAQFLLRLFGFIIADFASEALIELLKLPSEVLNFDVDTSKLNYILVQQRKTSGMDALIKLLGGLVGKMAQKVGNREIQTLSAFFANLAEFQNSKDLRDWAQFSLTLLESYFIREALNNAHVPDFEIKSHDTILSILKGFLTYKGDDIFLGSNEYLSLLIQELQRTEPFKVIIGSNPLLTVLPVSKAAQDYYDIAFIVGLDDTSYPPQPKQIEFIHLMNPQSKAYILNSQFIGEITAELNLRRALNSAKSVILTYSRTGSGSTSELNFSRFYLEAIKSVNKPADVGLNTNLRELAKKSKNFTIVGSVIELSAGNLPYVSDYDWNLASAIYSKKNEVNDSYLATIDPFVKNSILSIKTRSSPDITPYDGNLGSFDLSSITIDATGLNAYKTCPMQFFLSNILRAKTFKIDDEESNAKVIGNFVHSCLSQFIKKYPEGVSSIEEAAKELEDILEEKCNADLQFNCLNDFKQAEVITRAKYLLRNFCAQDLAFRKEHSIAKTIETEIELSAPIIVGSKECTAKARIDRVDLSRQDTIFITDYKTGKFRKTKSLVSELQLLLYAHLWAINKANQSINIAYWYLSSTGGETVSFLEPSDRQYSDEIKRGFESKAEKLLDLISSGLFPAINFEKDDTKMWYACGNCGVRAACRHERKVEWELKRNSETAQLCESVIRELYDAE
jgi:RecB family exonuclease